MFFDNFSANNKTNKNDQKLLTFLFFANSKADNKDQKLLTFLFCNE
jgi:hypothetical protein